MDRHPIYVVLLCVSLVFFMDSAWHFALGVNRLEDGLLDLLFYEGTALIFSVFRVMIVNHGCLSMEDADRLDADKFFDYNTASGVLFLTHSSCFSLFCFAFQYFSYFSDQHIFSLQYYKTRCLLSTNNRNVFLCGAFSPRERGSPIPNNRKSRIA